jgi:transposase
LSILWLGLDATLDQAAKARGQLAKRCGKYGIVKLWREVPGVGPIRAVTMLAYLDTPWRFPRKNKLWKYCGVGLQRSTSGKDRYGRPKQGQLHLPWAVNKRLKNAVIGATISAIRQGNNVFYRCYERLVSNGLTLSNARHTVARKLLTVMWAMWKTHRPFDPSLV